MFLLQISRAENVTGSNCDQYNKNPDWAHWPDSDCLELPRCLNFSTSYKTCKNCGGEILGTGHANFNTICIPSFFKQSLSQPPYNSVPMKDGNWNAPLIDIFVKMSNAHVIGIDTSSVTIGMTLETGWFDYRLQVWNSPPAEYYTWIYLSKEFRNLFWFPQIDVADNMVSKNEQDEKIVLLRWNNNPIPWIIRKYYLTTTINCEMNFETFPFDKHVCNLEVSCILFKRCNTLKYIRILNICFTT